MNRRRTNRNVPAKGRLRDMADALWSLAVRAAWNQRCAVCGKYGIQAHHIVPRQFYAVRYDLNNGIGLCPQCHKFDADLSPHQNAVGWLNWLQTHQHYLWTLYIYDPRPKFDGTTNAAFFCDVLRKLRPHVEPDEFVRLVGNKFSKWLEEGDV